jgi:hypothetical protein
MTLRITLLAGLFAVLCGLSLPAHAICIGCSLAVTKDSDLRFGPMVVVSGGSVTLNAQTGAVSGPVMTPASLSGPTGPATFRVTCHVSGIGVGVGGFSYRVSLVNTPTSVNASTTQMPIRTFAVFPSASNAYRVNTCRGYSQTFRVGATLAVDGSQAPGTYTSTTEIVLEATSSLL